MFFTLDVQVLSWLEGVVSRGLVKGDITRAKRMKVMLPFIFLATLNILEGVCFPFPLLTLV